MKKNKDIKDSCGLGTFGGMSIIGERGQMVVPKEIRKRLKLKAGDSFFVIEHFGKIVFVPQKMANDFFCHITKEWDKVNLKKKKINKNKIN